MTQRPRALVADDDVAIRVLVCRILTRNGFDVDAASDGAAAIEQILQRRHDVIILDLMMPRVDGFKVIEYLNANDAELLRRVIVMTAFGAAGFERVAALVRDCIEKPFEVSNLVQKARALLPPPEPAKPPAVRERSATAVEPPHDQPAQYELFDDRRD